MRSFSRRSQFADQPVPFFIKLSQRRITLRGMGPKSIRALALVSELVYGASPSWKDPARFSFAHGGKDGTPFPVDRATYDHTIQTLHEAVEEAKLDKKEKYNAIKRLERHASYSTS
jgi:uncharacterized protein